MRVALQALVLAAVAIAVWRLLARDGEPIAQAMLDVGPGRVALSLFWAAVGLWCTWRGWQAVLRGLQVPLDATPARRLFFVAQLGKYVPGSVWPVVLQAQAARTHGLRRAQLTVAYLYSVLIAVVVGITIAGMALVFTEPGALSDYWWVVVIAVAAAALLTRAVLPALMSFGLRLMRRPALHHQLAAPARLRAVLWSVGSWVGLGLHVATLASAFGPWGVSLASRSTGAMALAFVAGLLVVIAPAGAGVRDVILLTALSAVVSTEGALAVVLLSRVLLIVVDIALAGVAVTMRRMSKRGGATTARTPD